ncbi:hypothetical protein CF335_g7915 [Tilletia laevis]|nr:hypothetical protein CF335_g7915 [Tilletia laevis]
MGRLSPELARSWGFADSALLRRRAELAFGKFWILKKRSPPGGLRRNLRGARSAEPNPGPTCQKERVPVQKGAAASGATPSAIKANFNGAPARRLGPVNLCLHPKPFSYLGSPAYVSFLKGVVDNDEAAVHACLDEGTVRIDLVAFNELQKAEVKNKLARQGSLVALQHWAWTMRGYRFVFVAVATAFVDSDWALNEATHEFQGSQRGLLR